MVCYFPVVTFPVFNLFVDPEVEPERSMVLTLLFKNKLSGKQIIEERQAGREHGGSSVPESEEEG